MFRVCTCLVSEVAKGELAEAQARSTYDERVRRPIRYRVNSVSLYMYMYNESIDVRVRDGAGGAFASCALGCVVSARVRIKVMRYMLIVMVYLVCGVSSTTVDKKTHAICAVVEPFRRGLKGLGFTRALHGNQRSR